MVRERYAGYITRRQLVAVSIFWLALPLVMFLITWIKPLVGWPLAIAVVVSLVKCVKALDNADTPVIYIDRHFWLMIVLVLLFTAYSGIGGLFYQGFYDHAFRNAVFYDLVNYEWPVVRENTDTGSLELLCYYHAFWLPAAALAKMTGSLFVGNMAQLIYAFLGFVMIAIYVFEYLGKIRIRIWILCVLALYCGWDIVLFVIAFPELTQSLTLKEWYLCGKDMPWYTFSAPGLPDLVLYIYNQGIASLLALGLLYEQRNNLKSLVLFYSLMFLFAPIPTTGLLPATAYWVWKHLKRAFTVENIIGILVFIVVGLYFLSNNRVGSVESTSTKTLMEYIWKLAVFLLLSYVIYFPYIWKDIRNNIPFWILFVTASVVPFFSLDGKTDLGVRIGIPLTVCVAMMVIKTLTKIAELPRYKAVALVATLFIGAISSSGMYVNNVIKAYRCICSGIPLQRTEMTTVFDPQVCCLRDNFVADGESFFTKYLMKEVDGEEIHAPDDTFDNEKK